MKQKAVIYTRFSPRKNADESESCEIQLAFCEQHCAKLGLDVASVVHDPDASGADEFREKLWSAIDSLRKGWVLVVYKRDRLARNVYLAEQINRTVERKGASISAVSGDISGDSPEIRMIRQVLASVAEYERKIIAMRTSHAMRHHQANGRRMSSQCPYGWKDGPEGKMIQIPLEQSIVAEICARYAAGQSVGAIRRWLDEEHKDAARRGSWNYKIVKKICIRNTP